MRRIKDIHELMEKEKVIVCERDYRKLRIRNANCRASLIYICISTTQQLYEMTIKRLSERYEDHQFFIDYDDIIKNKLYCDGILIHEIDHYEIENYYQKDIYAFETMLESLIETMIQES